MDALRTALRHARGIALAALAHVWDDGYRAGVADSQSEGTTPNPYTNGAGS
ncbi:MAG: hypothetical protein J2P24_08290 [Streptosporangiales bacterium]|nr:hypothetical protein [Streptosporangiales bacterium]